MFPPGDIGSKHRKFTVRSQAVASSGKSTCAQCPYVVYATLVLSLEAKNRADEVRQNGND
jgi:hypothetical protein